MTSNSPVFKVRRNPFFAAAVFAVFFLLTSNTARAENYQTIINNGSSQNRVDIAIMGDGYTSAQLAQYHADVQSFIASVFAQEPYREYQRYYNVHMIDVISEQSGADHSDRVPPVFVNTALDAAYNCGNIQRLICVNTVKVNQVIARTLGAGQFDQVLVIVNDSEYGGSGGSAAVASNHPAAVELILHEVGHSFGLLADEYAGGGPSCNPNVEPPEVNATRQTIRAQIKWNYWINDITPVPTTSQVPGLAGLFQGAKYCDTGLYRPTNMSKMNVLGLPFEQINTEQHVKRIYNFVSPLDSSSPSGSSVSLEIPAAGQFIVNTPVPFTHGLTVNWQVNGQSVGSGPAFQLNTSLLGPGSHTVRAVITDATPFVRNDPQNLLSASRQWTVTVTGQQQPTTHFDYDGDGRSDLSVRRPSDNVWYFQRGTAGYTAMQFGVEGDRMAPADYDGDGKTDVAVFRPSNGTWYIYMSQSQTFQTFGWGQDGDLPVPTDRDADGKTDLVIFRPSNNTWYTRFANGTFNTFEFGVAGDKPVVGDFDGDGKGDIALYRPSNNNWYLLKSNLGFFVQTWGEAGDLPITGDFDGDGATDQAVFRPSTGTWYLSRTTAGFSSQVWGQAGDIPVAADYDSDGKTDVAVFRPSNGQWYIVQSGSGILVLPFGQDGDVPTQSSFNY